jgi:hypothetical protein
LVKTRVGPVRAKARAGFFLALSLRGLHFLLLAPESRLNLDADQIRFSSIN